MTLVRGRNALRPEPSRVDELPAGVAASEPETRPVGKPPYAPGSAAAREAGRRGGQAKRHRTALADELGLGDMPAEYRRAADNFAREQKAYLRRHVGGGELSPAVRSFVGSAALQLAASRMAFAAGQSELGSRLADSSRQNLLAAHELAARDAEARRRVGSPLARLLAPAGRAGGANGSPPVDGDQTRSGGQRRGENDGNAGGQ